MLSSGPNAKGSGGHANRALLTVAGAAILAAAVAVGALSLSDKRTAPPSAVTMPLPAARATAPLPPTREPVEKLVPRSTPAPKEREKRPSPRPTSAVDKPASEPEAEPAEAAAAEAAAPAASTLPLPNAVVARTIERIGYSCGQVTETVPVGAGGVYQVTCSSGQKYRARPINGRYHFRRAG